MGTIGAGVFSPSRHCVQFLRLELPMECRLLHLHYSQRHMHPESSRAPAQARTPAKWQIVFRDWALRQCGMPHFAEKSYVVQVGEEAAVDRPEPLQGYVGLAPSVIERGFMNCPYCLQHKGGDSGGEGPPVWHAGRPLLQKICSMHQACASVKKPPLARPTHTGEPNTANMGGELAARLCAL
jgi:hypothetical protein